MLAEQRDSIPVEVATLLLSQGFLVGHMSTLCAPTEERVLENLANASGISVMMNTGAEAREPTFGEMVTKFLEGYDSPNRFPSYPWIADLIFGQDKWVLRIYGAAYVPQMKSLADVIVGQFSVDIEMQIMDITKQNGSSAARTEAVSLKYAYRGDLC